MFLISKEFTNKPVSCLVDINLYFYNQKKKKFSKKLNADPKINTKLTIDKIWKTKPGKGIKPVIKYGPITEDEYYNSIPILEFEFSSQRSWHDIPDGRRKEPEDFCDWWEKRNARDYEKRVIVFFLHIIYWVYIRFCYYLLYERIDDIWYHVEWSWYLIPFWWNTVFVWSIIIAFSFKLAVAYWFFALDPRIGTRPEKVEVDYYERHLMTKVVKRNHFFFFFFIYLIIYWVWGECFLTFIDDCPNLTLLKPYWNEIFYFNIVFTTTFPIIIWLWYR